MVGLFRWFCCVFVVWFVGLGFFDLLARIFSVISFNSFKVTCASRHTQRLHPCKKEEVFIGCKALENFMLKEHSVFGAGRPLQTVLSSLTWVTLENRLEAWRYPNAFNVFEGCVKLATPKWLHYIPRRESDWIAPCK